MCLIVVKDNAEGNFTVENFDKSYSRNSDGMGIMWLENGRVKVERALGNLKQQRKVYQRHMDKPLFVLHQRYATHGAKNLMFENCHPYKVMDMDDGDAIDLYMAHNGVINNAKTTNENMSDTWNFVENHIKPIIKANPDLLWSDGIQMMISDYVGAGNKLVFLTNYTNEDREPLLIFNKPAGTNLGGCWLSNGYSVNNVTTYHRNNNRSLYENYYNANDDLDDDTLYGHGAFGSAFRANRYWEWADNKYTFNNKTFTSFKDMEEYKKEFDKKKTTVLDRKVPALIDQQGNELIKKKVLTLAEDDEVEKYKNELRIGVLDGTMTIDDVKTEFTTEELNQLQDEVLEVMDDTEQKLCAMVRATYDPENIDQEQLKNLVDKASKEFNTIDLEILVDNEPQVAVDMLEFLLAAHSSNKHHKAA